MREFLTIMRNNELVIQSQPQCHAGGRNCTASSAAALSWWSLSRRSLPSDPCDLSSTWPWWPRSRDLACDRDSMVPGVTQCSCSVTSILMTVWLVHSQWLFYANADDLQKAYIAHVRSSITVFAKLNNHLSKKTFSSSWAPFIPTPAVLVYC